ncbi:MAG: acyl-CoA synthetase [Microbacterium sp.]
MSDARSAARRAAPATARAYEVRHVQLARAALAAIAAVMITFSPDHSASVGLAVFSGWAIATALILLLGAWLAYPGARRGAPVLLGIVTALAGMVSGFPGIRSTTLFFVLVIAWALVTGAGELAWGIRDHRRGTPDARDGILIGALTIVLALGLLLVNPAYSLDYVIAEANRSFTLTGITIGVGLFGGYVAVVAVFLGIAGLSPRRTDDRPAGEPA